MLVETNCREMKKSRAVGIRESETKEMTSFDRSLVPRIFFFRSNTSWTRLRSTRNTMSRSRNTLQLMRTKTRTLPLTGNGTAPS